MPILLPFLAGALLCNCIPHLVAGLQGKSFPTPFAEPPGVGNSPPPVNFAWGSANLMLACLVIARRAPRAGRLASKLALAAGFATAGSYLSRHFGKARPTDGREIASAGR